LLFSVQAGMECFGKGPVSEEKNRSKKKTVKEDQFRKEEKAERKEKKRKVASEKKVKAFGVMGERYEKKRGGFRNYTSPFFTEGEEKKYQSG